MERDAKWDEDILKLINIQSLVEARKRERVP